MTFPCSNFRPPPRASCGTPSRKDCMRGSHTYSTYLHTLFTNPQDFKRTAAAAAGRPSNQLVQKLVVKWERFTICLHSKSHTREGKHDRRLYVVEPYIVLCTRQAQKSTLCGGRLGVILPNKKGGPCPNQRGFLFKRRF